MAKAPGPRSAEDAAKLARFEERMRLPILISALLPIILNLAQNDNTIANLAMVLTWFVFVYDFVVHMKLYRAYLHRGRGKFDLVVVILTAPYFLIPGLGNIRILSLARLARLARVVKAMGGSVMKLVKQLGRVGIVTGIILVTCAYIAYGAEKATNPEFDRFGQAMWWAIVTITTVGYGDVVPITPQGRFAGVILMMSGVAVLGVLAGTLASFFGFGDSQPAPDPAAAAANQASAVAADAEDELAELRTRLAELDEALAAVRQKLG